MQGQVPFEVIRDPKTIRERSEDLRRDGRKIAVVPTMGSLHEGHLSLVRRARASADIVIVTIFVNPTQFGPTEDLGRYPRDEAGDLAKIARAGADLAFCPAAEAMYAPGHQTTVTVGALAQPLCGASRPGHFDGVTSIVTKLFHLTTPHLAIFGQKDFQQLAVIRRMVLDLDFGIDIVGMPIVREPDGLALSSRNAYLTGEERSRARQLSAGLRAARVAFAAGERSASALLRAARGEEPPLLALDYLEIRDATSLEPIELVTAPAVLAVAAFVENTRLIDNTVLDPNRPTVDADPSLATP